MADTYRRLLTLFCAAALSIASAACGDDDGNGGPGVPVPDAAYSCVDGDGDGYGEGCYNGGDCDDDDPEVTDGCQFCLDNPIREGCACEPQEGLVCEPEPIPHPEGLLVCREGTRFCRDGLWTACEPLGEYVLVRNP